MSYFDVYYPTRESDGPAFVPVMREITKEKTVAKQLTREQRLERALRDLIRHYVCTLENARDRIVFLAHGDESACDPVDVMERGDPYLREARAALADEGESHERQN